MVITFLEAWLVTAILPRPPIDFFGGFTSGAPTVRLTNTLVTVSSSVDQHNVHSDHLH
jgi:hypothetical protein